VDADDFQRELDLAVGLVNTWDYLADDPEQLGDLPQLRTFLGEHGVTGEAKAASESDVSRLRTLRRRVRTAFEAESEAEAVEILNGLLADTVPQLKLSDGTWRFSYEPKAPRDLADRVAPRVAGALLELIRTEGWDRFGICEGHPCYCVFLDRSRNHSRRYCSQLCADRMAAAAYRRRAKEQSA
jgi:predicted RNA-binding Zn ribbon-like protein